MSTVALMHVPDGLIGPVTAIFTWAVAAVVVGYALRRSREELDDRSIPIVV